MMERNGSLFLVRIHGVSSFEGQKIIPSGDFVNNGRHEGKTSLLRKIVGDDENFISEQSALGASLLLT